MTIELSSQIIKQSDDSFQTAIALLAFSLTKALETSSLTQALAARSQSKARLNNLEQYHRRKK